MYRDNIFSIPVGDYFGKNNSEYQLIYAPLSGKMLIADKDSISDVNHFIRNQDELIKDKSIITVLNEITSNKSIDNCLSKINRVDDIQKMSILPNHTCNFSCSYCYSAKGRANVVLEKKKLKLGLDYFINPERLKKRYLTLSFIGGGEPLLSWNLVKYGIEYAHHLAEKYGFKLVITLISNGSVMNDEITGLLKIYHVLPDISFDILEETQNKQRKNYNTVFDNIKYLCDHGVTPSINATITPDTVNRLAEMFRHLSLNFPKIENMVFEPVVSPDLFQTPENLRAFYQSFLENFLHVRELAEYDGKNVTCRIYKNIDSLIDRGCPSKFTLTPQGDISICYCTSSPNEPYYEKRTYGFISDSSLHIDEKKFEAIHRINVHQYEKCTACFAKWHCGGGCMCPNDLYTEPFLDEICVFTKNLIKTVLLQRMEKQSFQYDNKSLKEQIL
jgi:radical SAM protein with 4Fe4S-binding SPASM domain